MKKIKHVHILKKDGGNRSFLALYDDGTWEELFRYHWRDGLNGQQFLRKTKSEALILYDRLMKKIET